MNKFYPKAMPVSDEPIEVRFTSLPSVQQVEDAAQDSISNESTRRSAVIRYRNAMQQLAQAQRRAAVIATQALRPADFQRHNHDYLMACREARRVRDEELLKVFSETCTKGL